jgi:hypothetical protein
MMTKYQVQDRRTRWPLSPQFDSATEAAIYAIEHGLSDTVVEPVTGIAVLLLHGEAGMVKEIISESIYKSPR